MHRKIMLGTVAMAGLMLLAACNRETASNSAPANTPLRAAHNEPAPGSKNETVSAVKDAVAGAAGTIAAELAIDQGFRRRGRAHRHVRSQAGQLATMRACGRHQEFRQHMVDDHTKSTNELKTHPDEVGAQFHAADAARLAARRPAQRSQGRQDEDFGGRYIAQQINTHNEALILMRGYAKDGDNPTSRILRRRSSPWCRCIST
jgi:putative membrane protein